MLGHRCYGMNSISMATLIKCIRECMVPTKKPLSWGKHTVSAVPLLFIVQFFESFWPNAFSLCLLLYDTQRGNLAVLTEALVYCIVVILHNSFLWITVKKDWYFVSYVCIIRHHSAFSFHILLCFWSHFVAMVWIALPWPLCNYVIMAKWTETKDKSPRCTWGRQRHRKVSYVIMRSAQRHRKVSDVIMRRDRGVPVIVWWSSLPHG